MVIKPSLLIGITLKGEPEVIKISLEAEEIRQAYLKEKETPSGKYQAVYAYRKPPYWKRVDLSQRIASSETATAKTKAKKAKG